MQEPVISIITPSFNQAVYLPECLASVHEQEYISREHLVVDGGSNDGSAAILQAHGDQLAYWVSESDKGQSDAINKGIERAKGTVFNWVNSDDALTSNALSKVAEAFHTDPELLLFGGRVTFIKPHGEEVFEPLNDAANALQLFYDPVINQPATYYRMDVIRAIGGVDSALRYVMDVELWWQFLFRYGTEYIRFERIELARFRYHEASKTVNEHAGFLDEVASLLHGMCTRTACADLAEVLQKAHSIKPGLRGIPVSAEHKELVIGMTVHFLLKWHGNVHDKSQFLSMKALQQSGYVKQAELLNDKMRQREERLELLLRPATWTTFRIRRKLDPSWP